MTRTTIHYTSVAEKKSIIASRKLLGETKQSDTFTKSHDDTQGDLVFVTNDELKFTRRAARLEQLEQKIIDGTLTDVSELIEYHKLLIMEQRK